MLKATKMSSSCGSSCETKGYNVCIENTTAFDILYEFFYAEPGSITIPTAPTIQSVTVSAGTTICYRVNVSSGAVVGVRAFGPILFAVPASLSYISCSVHLRAYRDPGFADGFFIVVQDCTPCPVSCSTSCSTDCKPVKKESSKKKHTPCKSSVCA